MRLRKRKPGLSEILLVAAVIIVMVTTCLVFIFGFGDKDEQPGNNLPGSHGSSDEQSMLLLQKVPKNPNTIQAGEVPSDPNSTEGESGYIIVSNDNDYSSVQEPNMAQRMSVIDIGSLGQQLLDELNAETVAHNAAAVSLVVYDGFSATFYVYQYGSADREAARPVVTDTKFRIASLSKLVTTICAMKLVDAGRLDLDEDISVYLGYNVRNPNYQSTPITSRMLMQHTSSIHDSSEFDDSIMGRARTSTQSLLGRSSSYFARPGSTFLYSNFGLTVLGAVVEKASGLKLDEFAAEVLFKPLDIDAAFVPSNLTDTGSLAVLYDAGHSVTRTVEHQLTRVNSGELGQDQHLAQGALVISALDYAKIVAMLGNGGVFLGNRILSPEAVAEMHRTDVSSAEFKHGLSTRFTTGGSNSSILAMRGVSTPLWQREDVEDYATWRYRIEGDSYVPTDGFFWHTGSAYGIFAQYIYMATQGTNEGVGGVDTSRGVVVVTTGARTARAPNGMIDICTHLSSIAWIGLGFDEK